MAKDYPNEPTEGISVEFSGCSAHAGESHDIDIASTGRQDKPRRFCLTTGVTKYQRFVAPVMVLAVSVAVFVLSLLRL